MFFISKRAKGLTPENMASHYYKKILLPHLNQWIFLHGDYGEFRFRVSFSRDLDPDNKVTFDLDFDAGGEYEMNILMTKEMRELLPKNLQGRFYRGETEDEYNQFFHARVPFDFDSKTVHPNGEKVLEDGAKKMKDYLLIINQFIFGEASPIPKDNNGRETCFWCGEDTEKQQGFHMDEYDKCPNCKR